MSQQEVQRFDFSHPGLWIPCFLHVNWRPERYKLLYGSRGRGATTNVVQVIVARMLKEQVKGMMVRKVFDDIRGSQWASIKEFVESKPALKDRFEFPKAPLGVICKTTGSELIARGMDNPGRAKSVPGLSLAWYEEADELNRDDLEQTSLSIRGENIEEWLTFNSPAADHWLLEEFFPGHHNEKGKFVPDLSFERPDGRFHFVKSRNPDAVIMHSNYLDNPFNKEPFIRKMDDMRQRSPERYRTSGLGLIGLEKTGMEFIPEFAEGKHVRANQYDPSLALHYTLDFNSAPYMTLLVAQIKQQDMGRWSVDFLKEYCLSHPLANTKAVCQAFAKDLQTGCFKGHKAGLFMYGDRSGKNKTSMATEAVRHDFDQAEAILCRWMHGNSDRVLRANPPHAKAAAFMGHCFGGRIGIDVTLDSSMHTAISDHVHLKQGADGGILKEYVTDPLTKVRYEKWGHCVQAAYYLVISAFRETHYDEMEELAGEIAT
jgi:phage terminase large subunit